MNEHQPLAAYNAGPGFLFESFAIFNELLLLDHLQRGAPTPAARAWYLRRFERDPAGFAPRYVALLKNGFDAEPKALLKRFVDIDLDAADTLADDASALMDERSAALARLYDRTAASGCDGR